MHLFCGTDQEFPPFTIEIEVVEEDTWQVMAAESTARDLDEHPIRLMTSLIDQKPLTPGDVIVRDKQWRMVIFNLDEEPQCRPEWIRGALQQLTRLIDQHKPASLSISLPGVSQGCLKWKSSLDMLLDELIRTDFPYPPKIWLKVPEQDLQSIAEKLTELSNPDNSE